MEEEDNPIAVGDIVNSRYKIVRCITNRSDRMIFFALDTQMKQVAIKFEQDTGEQTAVCTEAAILNILAGSRNIPQFLHFGLHKNYKYLAMELLGPNLIDLVNYKKPYKFSLHSILKFGIQAIEAIQVVHSKGFVHRDIKPGNFLIGNTPDTFNLFKLTGFGMCKKIHKVDGIITQPMNKTNF
ncbi:MAG: putative Casein kinase I [Streblomastix strix]|uniref:non-specific serine/threonine protein kinase n=1 Tax=Streblomastix strix TaxID=222440 RepID=A0A5J4X153_9EUKA|nr:MAG: putative Casein kinase I [Streblomastix strix]